MIIRQIEIFRSPIKLKQPFIISLGSFSHAENIVIRLTSTSGIVGFGECSPFASINGETAGTCMVVGQLIAKNLAGKNVSDPAEALQLMDRTIFGNSSIKSAFEIALFDIASQEAGLPLYEFLGGNKDKKIITDYTVSIGTPEKMASDAMMIKDRGFRIIKVKVGKEGNTDIERIRLIRKTLGDDIPLRIDANQGWKKEEAVEILNALAPFGIQFCEEPVPRWMFMDLPEIRRLSQVKIMADESCLDDHDAERLAALGACDYFNVKLGKSSGISRAVKIIRIAELSGMKVQIGGFLESRLGFSASAHLSMISEAVEFTDLDSPLMMEEDPVNGGMIYGPGGEVTLPETPGLGASVDEKFLQKLKKTVIKA